MPHNLVFAPCELGTQGPLSGLDLVGFERGCVHVWSNPLPHTRSHQDDTPSICRGQHSQLTISYFPPARTRKETAVIAPIVQTAHSPIPPPLATRSFAPSLRPS